MFNYNAVVWTLTYLINNMTKWNLMSMYNDNTMVWILTCMFKRGGIDSYVQRMFTDNIPI